LALLSLFWTLKIARVENRAHPLPADIVSLAGTSVIEVKELIEAIAGMKQILTQVDYRQAELEAKQATEIAKQAENMAVETDEAETAARIQLQLRSESATEAKKKAEKAREEAKEKAKEAAQASALVEQAKASKEPIAVAKKTKNAILATADKLQATVAQLKQVYRICRKPSEDGRDAVRCQ
jgi:hypothetical protein